MKTLKIISLLSAIVIMIAACKKNTDTSPIIQPLANGTLFFHLHTNIDTNEVDYGDTARDASGRKIVLSLAQFYISGITVKKADGSTYAFTGVYLLKKAENEQYTIGSIPAGNYTSVSFTVGLDSVTNSTSPASYADPNNVLAAQTPSMWFGSTSQGYIFMNVQGMADTSAGNNGNPNFPFSYKIGSNALRRTVTLPQQNFTVMPSQGQEVHMICDYGKLLQGVVFKTQNSTDTYTTNPSLATQIANNIPLMFRYEE